jgi:hypothetical protein
MTDGYKAAVLLKHIDVVEEVRMGLVTHDDFVVWLARVLGERA